MSKRVNPLRRARQRLAQAELMARDATIAYNAPDAAKLQQGRVRSSISERKLLERTHTKGFLGPRERSLEGPGLLGKIVDGKFKPATPSQKPEKRLFPGRPKKGEKVEEFIPRRKVTPEIEPPKPDLRFGASDPSRIKGD